MYTCSNPLNLFIQYLMNSNQAPHSSFSFFLVYQLLVANIFNIFCCRWPWLECLHRYVSFDQNFPLMRKSCVLLNVIEDMLAMHLSLNKLSDEKFIQKCDVLYWAKGIGMAVQDEQNSCSVPAEM